MLDKYQFVVVVELHLQAHYGQERNESHKYKYEPDSNPKLGCLQYSALTTVPSECPRQVSVKWLRVIIALRCIYASCLLSKKHAYDTQLLVSNNKMRTQKVTKDYNGLRHLDKHNI